METPLFYHNKQPIFPLGFGCMRLPVRENGEINLEHLEQMVDYYIAHGGSYFDTAFGYHKQRSESAMREALVRRYQRDSFLLATKLPAWKYHVHSAEQARDMFYTQLERLDCGWMDYYLFQNMGEERTEAFDRYDLWSFVSELKEKGLVHHFGVSVHDKPEHIEYLLNSHPEIEFVQLQINYADWKNPSVEAMRCYEVAEAYQKPVVVMEPVKGGVLNVIPPEVQKIFDDSAVQHTNPEWALLFAASHKDVALVLSGMSDLEQVRENVSSFKNMKPMSEEESLTIEKVQDVLKNIDQIACTDCRYCMEECPGKVKIPKVMTALNFEKMYQNRKMAVHYYFSNVFLEGKASQCLQCGRCEKICPQHISICSMLKDAVRLFGE